MLLQSTRNTSIIMYMADHLSEGKRSWNMSRIRSRDTIPELFVRKKLTNLGVRYRLHVSSLPGKPDIVIKKQKIAVFVNGCFWHQHPGCSRSTSPKTNKSYWEPKLRKNIERQKKVFLELRKDRWNIITIWECEAKRDDILNNKLQKELAL
jgi:DNA mismatch endonuclease, patch repair protein